MPRRFNNCEFNHPCPIFCPNLNTTCSNDVVNPTTVAQFGAFANTAVGTVDAATEIPLTLFLDGGISSLTLPSGNYSVTYFARGTVPESGTMSVELQLDGEAVSGSQISTTATAGEVANLTQTVTISTTSGGTLTLVNASSDAVTFTLAGLLVTRL